MSFNVSSNLVEECVQQKNEMMAICVWLACVPIFISIKFRKSGSLYPTTQLRWIKVILLSTVLFQLYQGCQAMNMDKNMKGKKCRK